MKPEKVALAAQLYASGHSLAEIGTHLDVHASTVHKVLKKAGVKMRDTHGRQQ
nr:helix-turn-helix domain-containing protein [Mycolicibacterium malmesburyense]